jgi:type IV pilus assembly protein PilP
MRAPFPTIAALALALLPACSSAPGSGTVASSQAALASPPPAQAFEVAPAPPRQPIPDGALVEGPHSRDPFRAFSTTPPSPPPDGRPRKAHRIPVEELKLVALVTHTATPRAMLVDRAGKGYIVTQGELVGRPEPSGDRADRLASFRVDRIREGDVVLVREDAADPHAPAATRVLALSHEPLLQADD